MWRAAHKELRDDYPILPWLVEHAGSVLCRFQKGRDGRTPFERLHGKKPTQEFVPLGEKVLARPVSSEPLNRMNLRCKVGVWLGVRNNSAVCFVGTAEGVLRVRELRRIEHQNRWDKEVINNVIGVPWKIADDKWIVDRPATQDAPVQCDQIWNKLTPTPCRVRIEECPTKTPEGLERLDRRSEVLNEALAKEVESNDRRRKEIGSAGGELAAPQKLKDTPIPPDSDPRKRDVS